MEHGIVRVYSGCGKGKTSAAIGKAVQEAGNGKNIVIITFLKGMETSDYIKRLEPEVKVFTFEKSDGNFEDLPEERQQEEIHNIRNGLNFAKKVLTTGECNVLILDEVLGLVDQNIITAEELKAVLDARQDDVSVILTGIHLSPEIRAMVDEVSEIETTSRETNENV